MTGFDFPLRIPDHEDRAAALLRTAFRDKPRINALIRAIGHGVQMLEDELFDLIGATSLDGAEGEFLDDWLELFGERGQGLTGQEKRMVLRGKILAHRCSQNVNDRIRVLQELTGGLVEYERIPKGCDNFYVWRSNYMSPAHRRAVARIFDGVRPLGRAVYVVEALSDGYFGFQERTRGPLPSFGILGRRLLP